MIICPLCEHAQASGAECEVCGRTVAPSAAAAAVLPLEGLEPTRLPPETAPDPGPLEGLEPTGGGREAGVLPLVSGAPLELEPVRAAPVDVAVEPLPGLERNGEGAPETARTPLPAVTVCRYCRTPALPGERRCERCGMRLPLVEPPRAAAAAEPEDVRRCTCGAPVAGARCPACGARNPGAPEG